LILSASPVKTGFLEFLLQLGKNNKSVPLTLDKRVQLVKLLLNSRLAKFNFLVLGSDVFYFEGDEPNAIETYLMWEAAFNEIWTALAEKCPDLSELTEFRPEFSGLFENINKEVFSFAKLKSLETGRFITPGIHTNFF